MTNEDQPTRFQTVWINQARNPSGITVANDDESFFAGLASARNEHETCSLHRMTSAEARELGNELIAAADKVDDKGKAGDFVVVSSRPLNPAE